MNRRERVKAVVRKHLPPKGGFQFDTDIDSRIFDAPSRSSPFFDQVRDPVELRRLRTALTDIQHSFGPEGLTGRAKNELGDHILYGRFVGDVDSSDAECVAFVRDTGQPAAHALKELLRAIPVFLRAIDSAGREIDRSAATRSRTGRMNNEGIMIVAAAREVWEDYHKRQAPRRDLNPATPFGRFLADLFDAMETDQDPRSAFRAWAKIGPEVHIQTEFWQLIGDD